MPMTFTDDRLLSRGERLFRKIKEGEPIADYRAAFADFMEPQDFVKAMEIRTGRGWDKWTDDDVLEALRRNPEKAQRNPMMLSKIMGLLANSQQS